MATNNLWERQPKESEQAYAALSAYRDMGLERTATAVARKLSKSRQLIDRWKQANNWDARVRQWDNDIAAKVKEAAEKGAAEMVQRHLKIALQLQTKAVTALNQIAAVDMTARDIAAILKLGVDIERLNRGEPTDRTEGRNEVTGRVTIATDPYAELTVEELRKLAQLADEQEN